MLTELNGPVVEEMPRTLEASRITLPQQVIAKTLVPGEIGIGLRRTAISRFKYSSNALIVCRKDAEEWFCLPSPMKILLIPIPQHSLEIAKQELRTSQDILPTPHLQDARVLALINAIQAEAEAGFPTDSIFIESILLAIASALLPTNHRLSGAQRKSGLTIRQLRHIEEFIRENLQRNIHLSDLADSVQLSQGHFTQMFRKTKGVTPHQYLMDLRLDRARQLLLADHMKIIDVAGACGFRNQQHFATAFRARFGITPSSYRRVLNPIGLPESRPANPSIRVG